MVNLCCSNVLPSTLLLLFYHFLVTTPTLNFRLAIRYKTASLNLQSGIHYIDYISYPFKDSGGLFADMKYNVTMPF